MAGDPPVDLLSLPVEPVTGMFYVQAGSMSEIVDGGCDVMAEFGIERL